MKYIYAIFFLLFMVGIANAGGNSAWGTYYPPFQYLQTKVASATSTTSSVSFTGDAINAPQVLVTSAGPNTSFFRCGVGAQTAVVTDTPLLSGTVQTFTKNAADTCAVITSGANTATVYFTAGGGE